VALWQSTVPGATCRDVGRRLAISPRTLRRWRCCAAEDPPGRAPGRPPFRLDREVRREIRQSIKQLGTRAGVATFKARFPKVPCRTLAAIKHHYRYVLARWRRRQLARLEWTRPGSVWAIDHAEPPLTIAGKYDHLLAVRDLASGQQLAWEPIRQADATTSVEVLARLFAEHAPPLVLKSDNGKALTSGGVPALLAAHEVTPLVSPPYRPQYNGSCEAGVKAMKVRSEDLALIHDRSRHWSSEDLADALRIANEFYRSGPHSLSHAQRWQQRTAITATERASFLAALAACRAQLAAAQAYAPTKQHTRTLERRSVVQTLVELDLLVIHRRPNTPPHKSPKADRIS
jgi:transposase InsO family protein